MQGETARSSGAARRARRAEHAEAICDCVAVNTGDARPGGVKQPPSVKRVTLATLLVDSDVEETTEAPRLASRMTAEQFDTALTMAIREHQLFRYEMDGRVYVALMDEDALYRVQRRAGERGDSDTVARAQRALAELSDRGGED